MSPALFAEHMSYLSQHNYTPLTVTQLVRFRQSRELELPGRPVVLTFDDGFADFYTDALPVLKSHGFTATLYVVTGFVGGTSHQLKRKGEYTRPMLNWWQLVEICASGIECGAHSHTHPYLDVLPMATARAEIIVCRKLLQDQLGQTIRSFAYPYGYYTTTVQQVVREAGYSSACAVKYAPSSVNDDPFALSRLIVTADTRVDDLAALLEGRSSPLVTAFRRTRAWAWRCVRQGAAPLMRLFPERILMA